MGTLSSDRGKVKYHNNSGALALPTRSVSFVRKLVARYPRLVRWVLCGPVTLVLTLLILMGSAHWVPAGAARVDNILLPVTFFPLIWAAVFFYALAEDNLVRGVAVMGGLIVGHVGLLVVVM